MTQLPKTGKLMLNIFLILFHCFVGLEAFAQSRGGNWDSSDFEGEIGPKKSFFKIDGIEVEGIKKVEKEAILEKINAKKGVVLDNYLLKKDLERIYGLKYFESVGAHHNVVGGKNILLFKVREKPIIAKISIVGNDEVDTDDIKEQVKTKEFAILDINTIKLDQTALLKFYEEKGYFLATVSYELKKIDDENVELIFRVSEFDKVRVKNIVFLGNKAFSAEELKGIMATKEEGLFSFMSDSGNFKEFDFQSDIERIKYFYSTKGFLQVNVGSPEITVSENKKWVFITIQVTEGTKYFVNEISFKGEVLFGEKELLENLKLLPQETYSEALLREDIQALTEKYQDEGYAFANVLRHVYPIPGENKVDIEYSFEKGKIAYFGKINVSGNLKTRDKVVRREIKIREGMKFSGSLLRESKENVNRLGFFEPGSVVFNTVSPRGKDDVLDVEILIKEKSTGQISLGAGYSTSDKGFFQASISQNNFRGLGQSLALTVNYSGSQQTYSLSFTEPYFYDSLWTAGGEVFYTENDRLESYSYRKKGSALRLGYPIFEYTRLFGTYKLENTELRNVRDETVDAQAENGITSSIRLAVVRDRRNHRFEPSKGYFLSLSTQYAGLGFDKKWWKNEFDGQFFHRVVGDLVFRSRLYTSKLEQVDGQAIPQAEKFMLGGSRNLRGYGSDRIGPKRYVPEKDRNGNTTGKLVPFNTGGLYTAYTTLELEHPLAREAGLKWVLFYDAGHVGAYDNFKLFMDYGFGFRWFSPIGVLRFEFGFPINPEDRDKGSQFHFDIGQLF